MHPLHVQSRDKAVALYKQQRGTGRTTNRVSEAVTFATQGRVGTLFIPVGVHRWGSFDTTDYKLDLLDLAALQTRAHGGTVYVVKPEQMPNSAQAIALLRY